jgi:hypothetical protein
MVYGTLSDGAGRPVAVDVVDGAELDHQTVPAQLDELNARFGPSEVVLVADRGIAAAAGAADGVVRRPAHRMRRTPRPQP